MVIEFDDYVKTVIPAQAGIQANPNLSIPPRAGPVFTGMTKMGAFVLFTNLSNLTNL